MHIKEKPPSWLFYSGSCRRRDVLVSREQHPLEFSVAVRGGSMYTGPFVLSLAKSVSIMEVPGQIMRGLCLPHDEDTWCEIKDQLEERPPFPPFARDQ